MTWTSVPKPTSSLWTTVAVSGRETYDQADITYDSATTFYDGINPNQYTSVPKPTSSLWTMVNKPV